MGRLLPLTFVVLLALTGVTEAREAGYAVTDCSGCHSGSQVPTVSISTTPETIAPGATVLVRVRIAASAMANGGLYLRTTGRGTFAVRSGQNTKLAGADGIVHSSPRSASAGSVTFDVDWTAPSTAGGASFEASVVSGNGNGASSGDGAANGLHHVAFGCEGTLYFRDDDRDGHGAVASGTAKDCALPEGFSASNDDCNDNHELMYPGAPELCNGRDDDCDGTIDEGHTLKTYFRDADGDGFGSASGGTHQGCAAPMGYVADDTDCDDSSAFVNPVATEQCNGRDDDCDGQVDESTGQVSCGIGACMRTSNACTGCLPGNRAREVCNGIDDDCDGLVDDDPAGCGEDELCREGACVSALEPADAGTHTSKRPPPSPSGCATGGLGALPLFALLVLLRRR